MPELSPCRNEVRQLLHERVGQFFFIPDNTEKTATAPCPVCGAVITGIPTQKTPVACQPQRSLSSQRERLVPGAPRAFGSPTEAGKRNYKFYSEGSVIMLGEDEDVAITQLAPVKPLPARLRVIEPAPGLIRSLTVQYLRRKPEPYSLLVAFAKRSDILYPVSPDPDIATWISGKDVLTFSRSRLAAAIEAARSFGKADFQALGRLKREIALGEPSARRTLAEIEKRRPDALRVMRDVPPADGREARIAAIYFDELVATSQP